MPNTLAANIWFGVTMGLLKKLFNKKINGKKNGSVPELNTTLRASPADPGIEPLVIREITSDELVVKLEEDADMAVIDLRQPWEYAGGHIPNAINIPLPQLPFALNTIPRDKVVIMQCYHGIISLDASGYLIQSGWDKEQVYSLSEGITGWIVSQGLDTLSR